MLTRSHDVRAVVVLVALWLLFFWRLFTPIAGDQASLTKGDFSGQFVAFAGYQYERFTEGQVPLWNPYNNSGLPFIADTQAAVFYPPRLLTIALARLFGGWSYHALELEMTAHILAYSLMMYLLVRRLTAGQSGSAFGGFVAAIIAAYGGFMSGYPPLQLAILEAGIWLPLAVLGVLEATRDKPIGWRWLLLSGFALGVSWLAGHPQTSWFLTSLIGVYFIYNAFTRCYRWTVYIGGLLLLGMVTSGIAAVQLFPGVEYLVHTARIGLTFEDKGNGFPFQDLVQFIFPNVVSLWSPLYVGIVGLGLAVLAIRWRTPRSLFWGMVVVGALALSFGANSAAYDYFYNTAPGLRFFRGQERAAYLVSASLAILAGIGASYFVRWGADDGDITRKRIRRELLILLLIVAIVFGMVFVAWLGNREAYGPYIGPMAFSTLISALALLIIPWVITAPKHQPRRWILAGLIVFDLFSVNMNAAGTYEPIPPTEQLSMTPPPLVAQVLTDDDGIFRVDGFRGLTDNYGSLYGVMDMRGISPLFLDGPFRLIEPDKINPLAWELFAVRFVFTDWNELPVPSEIVGTGEDRSGPINLHRLSDPRPFAQLTYEIATVDSDEFAFALLHDPNFNPRRSVILNRDVDLELPDEAPQDASATVTEFEPELFTIAVDTPTNAVLSLAHPDYPGWQATIDGTPAEILRAYGALSAVAVQAGEHTIRFVYDPLSYRFGALISLITWTALIVIGIWGFLRRPHPPKTDLILERLKNTV